MSRAEGRWALEATGTAVHTELARISRDAILLSTLRSGHLNAALSEANRQLIHHVVKIRVTRGSRVLIDANPTSFSVAGPEQDLRDHDGRFLGRLRVTIQDVLGFVKLVHKFTHAEVVVRGRPGQVVSSLSALTGRALPWSGCTRVSGRNYLVESFGEHTFSGDHATVWILLPA